MMQLTCPCCHAHVPLEAALQDEAGREMMGLMAAMPTELSRPLVHYLAYFRPAKQQLGWGRALRMTREVLALCVDQAALASALLEAARSLDDKRAAPGWRPLGNHNYLKRCIESTQDRHLVAASEPGQAGRASPATPRSKAGGALVALEGMRK